ncbi:MAG: primase protein [Candidatus Jorgensenbacteria bacterium GW2011_GWA1_48_11]|uniref:DNA primase n=1 Tax=Candidatus Jorgensenbacteria bacterium GW2011_GWA1_48_11 TaxID=1618660 RepID=A0A0G1UAN4_9BACT|nr:MAG: primase protein [Candidatus Jorgensenbacteria bacterium GW2011_GWA1_48_11]
MAKDVDLIKQKLDLVEFLRGYLNLLPAGKNFKALCPFHQEKTPSFVVSPERGIWHCFGCGEGGDIVKFAMKYENLEFPEALRFLAEKAGVSIGTMNPAEQKEFGILYDLHEKAKDFFRENLIKNKEAMKYLLDRGLKEKTITEFELGYAPGGDSLTVYLINNGFDISDIQRAGLAHKNVRGLYRDRFDSRIIFPIMNHMGRVVAFTGRLLPNPNRKYEVEPPKYLNSPETPIFVKSKILYGLNKSKHAVGQSRTVFMVEGQMDFLMAWQSGVENIVAVSGTGLTPQHLMRLRRLADTVVINFDNDEAGLKALERSLDVFNSFDFHVKVLDLGKYKDAAEAVQSEPEYLTKAAAWAKPAFSRLFQIYFGSGQKTLGIAERKRILRHLLAKISNVRSPVEQNIWLKELAQASGIAESALTAELNDLPKAKEETAEAAVAENTANRQDLIATRLLALAFAKDSYLSLLQERLQWLPAVYQSVLQNPKEKAEIFELRSTFEFSDATEDKLEWEFNELMRNLELEFLKKERSVIQEAMQSEGGNSEAMQKFHDLSKRIDELK